MMTGTDHTNFAMLGDIKSVFNIDLATISLRMT